MKPAFLQANESTGYRSIRGNLSIMPLADLIQWIDSGRLSGTLVTESMETSRHFYFQHGKLIFAWSDNEGERFCVLLQQQLGLKQERLESAMEQSEHLGLSLLGLLSCNEGVCLEQLSKIMGELASLAMSNALTWKTGQFYFSDHLPPAVLSSPVALHTKKLLFEVAVRLDESAPTSSVPLDPVMNELLQQIESGTLDVPPMPCSMQVLFSRISDPALSINEIVESITDPLLVAKVLRVCNSGFYGLRGSVTTIREAVVYMGLKALTSIVTVHALSNYSARNRELVEIILHHSMMVGMLAKQLARDTGANHDQAFVCGLLHDLGKVVMLELLDDYHLPIQKRDLLVEQHHAEVGRLVAQNWNFSSEIQEVIRFHHEPVKASDHNQLIELIHLANLIARNESPVPLHFHRHDPNDFEAQDQSFNDHLELLDQEIESILGPI